MGAAKVQTAQPTQTAQTAQMAQMAQMAHAAQAMGQASSTDPQAAGGAAGLPLGRGSQECAAMVRRANGQAVRPAEVLKHRDYGTHVVVVTRDGQKLDSREADVQPTRSDADADTTADTTGEV